MAEADTKPQEKSFFVTILIIVAYLGLNSSLNMLQKWTLGIFGMRLPLTITCSHMLFSFIMLLPIMLMEPYSSQHRATLQKQWKGLMAIGVFLAANIAFNNWSLVHLSLSLNQVIRSAIPVITAVLAVFIEHKTPTGMEFASLCVLSAGVMVAVWEGSASGSPVGICMCLIATFSNAAMMSTAGRVLSEKIDVLRLTFYTAPVSCIALAPFMFAMEAGKATDFFLLHSTKAYVVLLAGSGLALAYNLVHYMVIQRTSAVTTTVLGEVKIVALLIMSAAFLNERAVFTPKMSAGVALALAGFFWFSHLKIAKQKTVTQGPVKHEA